MLHGLSYTESSSLSLRAHCGQAATTGGGGQCACYQFACESVHECSAVRISGSWLESLPEDNFGTKTLLSAMTNRNNRIMPIP